MSAEQIIYDTLRQAVGVTALVGSGSSARIYPDVVPQEVEELPAVTYERIGSQPEYTLDGTLAATRATMQVICWGSTRVSAEQLADAVVTAMLGANIPPQSRAGEFDSETETAAVAVNFDIWEGA